MSVTTDRIAADDRAAWEGLYAGYADFYGVSQTPEMRATVWGWLMDPQVEVWGKVARDAQGRAVGIAHYRPFRRPLSASTGGFLDDLFVAPEARGSGAAQALLAAVAEDGRARGWTVLRWITAQDNARARKVYDGVAQATPWVTYDMVLTG